MASIKSFGYNIKPKMPFVSKGIFFGLILLLLGPRDLHAQFFDAIETSLKVKPHLDFKFDTRNSFIGSKYARIYGLKLGLDFDKTFKLGVGYNWLSSDLYRVQNVANSEGEIKSLNTQFKLGYFTPYAEYVFYNKDPWDISILVLVGGGYSHYTYWDDLWVHMQTSRSFVFIYEPYMTAQYRVFSYFGVGAGVGFRLAYSSDRFSRTKLNSPIYVFKLKIYLSEFVADMKDKF